ncbi:hypothetical protein FQN50_008950 [Emmonsiellopsis sp. PD_5]|nr:hypothetical protein FQN50_008950 [Emmonsiellopsis sp. PD_5]
MAATSPAGRGRNNMLQVCSPSVVSFCEIADDESVPLAERCSRLATLGRDMSANMQNCLAGKSHLRFLEVMKHQWPADEVVPAMFKGNTFCVRVAIDGTTGSIEPFTRCLDKAASITAKISRGK